MTTQRRRKAYMSKGQRPNLKSSTVRLTREMISPITKLMNIAIAWKKGQNPWVTVRNPNATPDRLFTRIRANALYGDPKKKAFSPVEEQTFVSSLTTV